MKIIPQQILPFSLALLLAASTAATAQTTTAAPVPAPTDAAAPAAPVTTAIIHGHITDPSGALIPGARVSLVNSAGTQVSATTSDSAGRYSFNTVKPGTYLVQSSFDGFSPSQSPQLTVVAGASKRVDIPMAIEGEQQNVVVTDETPQVSVEAGGNVSAVVLKGKDLDALSDDPDELANELSALAGPSAGPNGGQIYIDGFSGGQLPPKSAIREIRINQNPFSAEFDRLGYGRIEILTKPGTDKLHGQLFVNGNDKNFNTGNPFAKNVPDYYSYQFNANLSGSLNKKTSFNLSMERRDQQNVSAFSIPNAVLFNSVDKLYEDITNYAVDQLSPHIRTNGSARFDVQLGARNTLTVRYGFWSEDEHGNLGTLSLPSTTTRESNTDHTVQISDSIVINDHIVNENRFQFERQNENHYPDSPLATINIAGDMTGGGASSQKSLDHTTRLEYWNITTMSAGKQAIKFGTRLRDTRDANLTTANFNGSFGFSNWSDYKNLANGLLGGQSFSSLVQSGFGPSTISYSTGSPSTLANVFDAAVFFQDDWKVNPYLTLSGGLRWESQNHISDHSDWAPRVSLAYALDGHGKGQKTKTVLRAGYGFFYDRLGSGSLLTVNRANVASRVVLNNPTGCAITALDGVGLSSAGCVSTSGSSTAATPIKYQVAPGYQSPNTEQLGMSLERQVSAGTSMTITYLRSLGIHQLVSRNINQGTANGYLYQFDPEAVFKQNQMIISGNAKLSKTVSVMGSYTLGYGNTNGAGGSASNAYKLDADYGRSSFVARNQLFLMSSIQAPWGIRVNPFLVATAGRPYNITLATDTLNGFGNQRPSLVSDANCSASNTTNTGQFVHTSFGCLNTQPAENDARIKPNLGNGPASVALNMRISRSFGIGPKVTGGNSADGPGPGGPPPGGGGGRGGPGGGGLGPGGLGSGGGRPPAGMFGSTVNRKYSLNFSLQAQNIFNDMNYGTPNGTIVPTLDAGSTNTWNAGSAFGHSQSLAGGFFTGGSTVASRRIFGQVVFSF